MALLGKTDSFYHNSDGISEYIKRVDHYFFANDIDDAKKKMQYFQQSLFLHQLKLLGTYSKFLKNTVNHSRKMQFL